MAVEPDGKIMFGVPVFYYYETAKKYKAWVHPRYYLPIGVPIETNKPENIDLYIPKNHVTYVRRFKQGIVLVNSSNENDVILLDDYYFDIDIGKAIKSVNLASATAKILLKMKND